MINLPSLDAYPIPLLHDKETFDILSALAYLGPSDTSSVNEFCNTGKQQLNLKLLNLYKSGFVFSNNQNKWCLSGLGNLTLSKVGVTQTVIAIYCESEPMTSKGNWISGLICNERDLWRSASNFRTLSTARWIWNHSDQIKRDVNFDVYVSSCLLAGMTETYSFNADLFYESFVSQQSHHRIGKRAFKTHYAECKKMLTGSDLVFYKPDKYRPSMPKSFLWVSVIRLLVLLVSNHADSGLMTAFKRNFDILRSWFLLKNELVEIEFLCTRYLGEHLASGEQNDVVEKIKWITKSYTESAGADATISAIPHLKQVVENTNNEDVEKSDAARVNKILVDEHDGAFLIKLIGDVRLTFSSALDNYIDHMFESPHFRSVTIDLCKADNIDSTALGQLAKLAISARRQFNLTPVILSTNPDINRILKSMGFDRVFDIRQKTILVDELLYDLPLVAAPQQDVMEHVLDAHRVLMSMNDRNRAQFQELVQALEAGELPPSLMYAVESYATVGRGRHKLQ